MKFSKSFLKASLFLTLILIVCISLLLFFYKKPDNILSTKSNTNSSIKLINKNNEIKLKLEIAQTNLDREKGYMFRKEISSDESMLFIFENSTLQNFWMKDTYVPLDMIFFDENKNFVSVKKNAQPCLDKGFLCPSYSSNGNAKYVLETKAGVLPESMIDENLRFEE